MLERLYVRNFALINKIDVEFKSGLNVLSGETGAGKSLLIGSLGFVLGGKADKSSIQRGCEETSVSVIVDVSNESVLSELENKGVEVDEDKKVLIERSFNINGRSVCKINGKPVTVGMLKSITALFVDIHGQHEHQSLLDPKKHITLLDKLCGAELEGPFSELAAKTDEYKKLNSRLKELDADGKDAAERLEIYKLGLDEIRNSGIYPGEDEELSAKKKKLINLEKIVTLSSNAVTLLSDGENGAISTAGGALSSVEELAGIDENYKKAVELLQSALIELEEARATITELNDDMGEEGESIDVVEERISLINRLKRRYGETIEDVLSHADELENKIFNIENSAELVREIKEKRTVVLKEISHICDKITEIRRKCAKDVSQKIENVLRELSMENARFDIKVEQKKAFTRNGRDEVEFLISANKGEELKPLSKIASGGEMSRVMLALKTILADADNIDTFVFDEIDTGISGRTAQRVAEKMLLVSRKRQLLCITHLPQIAAMADTNFLIEKNTEGDTTSTRLIELSEDEVYDELARLTGGIEITQAVRAAAKELKSADNKLKEKLK